MDATPAVTAVERDLAAYYDQEANVRAGRPLDAERVAAREEFVALLGAPVGRLLEVGAGAGRDAGFFVERGIAAYGVDLSLEQLRHAQRCGALATVASVRRLPFPDGWFDAAWTMSTLMHVPEDGIRDALAEIRRVLAPGAVAAIGVWGGADIEERKEGEPYDPPRLFSRRSDERWQSLLGTVGTLEVFRTWGRGGDEFWYQWAILRRAGAGPRSSLVI